MQAFCRTSISLACHGLFQVFCLRWKWSDLPFVGVGIEQVAGFVEGAAGIGLLDHAAFGGVVVVFGDGV